MQFNHFHQNQDDGFMSIEEIKTLRIHKKKLEKEKKARRYIMEINERYKKIRNKNNSNFFKKINPFQKAALISNY